MMRRALGVVGLLVLLVPASADAVTPTAPIDGARDQVEHPTFTWTLDGSESDAIRISRQARTTPAGEFYSEDVVDFGVLDNAATTWAPTSAIAAGTYWWSVAFHSPDFDTTGNTSPWSFTIPTRLRAPTLRIVDRYDFVIAADAGWWSNTSSARVVAELKVGKRRVGRVAEVKTNLNIAARNSASYLQVPVKKWARGKRGTFTATVTAGGRTITISKPVAIPAT